MSDQASEDDRQFEQVLSRLDALMKRSHGAVAVEEAVETQEISSSDQSDVPVLTEVYTGPELSPLELVASAPPVLTDMLTTVVREAFQHDAQGVLSSEEGEEASPLPRDDARHDIEEIIASLLPAMQARMALVIQEELQAAQEAIAHRVKDEAEALLRLHLSGSSVTPK